MQKFSIVLIAAAFVTGACTKTASSFQIDSSQPSVIGGSIVSDAALKLATVGVYLGGGECSGSYIGNGKVVTAGHCLHGSTAEAVGFNHPDGPIYCDVTGAYEHPDYKKTEDPWFDVAVLKIDCGGDQRIDAIQPYRFPTSSDQPTSVSSAGYGLASTKGRFNFPNLKTLPLTPFDVNDAINDPTIDAEMKKEDKLQELATRVQEGRLFCYEAKISETVFFGDSGGPHYFTGADSRLVLQGVNVVLYTKTQSVNTIYSFCAASANYYRSWIEAQ